jgi:hypothetical protein
VEGKQEAQDEEPVEEEGEFEDSNEVKNSAEKEHAEEEDNTSPLRETETSDVEAGGVDGTGEHKDGDVQEENVIEKSAKKSTEKTKKKGIADDSDFEEENFSDEGYDAMLEEDLHITDASEEEEEIAVSNPEVLNHFGDKIEESPEIKLDESPPKTDHQVLRDVTFNDTVDEIVARLNTKAVIEEGEGSAVATKSKEDFSAFNWKPDVAFFQFGGEPSTAGRGPEVFSFARLPRPPPGPARARGASVPRWAGPRPRRVATGRQRAARGRDSSV